MHLHELRHDVKCEGIGPYEALRNREEKLNYLGMMLAVQGLDPQPILKRVRGFVDPEFRKSEGQKMSFKNWLERAKRGEIRKGISHGRKIEIIVTESIMGKLRDILSGRKESNLLKKALDNNPEFAYIIRVARQINEPVYNNSDFWNVVNRLTGNKGDEIRNLVNAYHDIDDVEPESESINEAKVSDVMLSLGLDNDTINGLMGQYNIKDEDHNISRLKRKFSDIKKTAGGVIDKTKGLVKGLPSKAKGLIKGLPGKAKGLPGKAKGLAKTITSKDVRSDNEDYAEDVVKIAYKIMQAAKEATIRPGDLTRGVG